MPTQIVHSSNGTTELTYGGTGERVKKRVYSGGNVTDTYYIGDHFEVKGGETIKYIFAGNLRVAQVKGTTRSFFHKDHLGSSTVMTNASGAVIESTEYAPFGSQRVHTGTNTSDYRFTDQELDAENGLYNYNARLYDPLIGRFISPDSIVPEPYNPQSFNRYSYCLNNPLIYVDPSGHVSEEDLLKAGYTYDKETGDWLMPGIEVTAPRVYMCTNGFGGLAYLTSEQIMGSWGVWHVIEPVPSVPEINNEYQQRLERYLSGGADRLPIPVEGAEISSWYHRDPDGPLKGAIHGAVDIAAPEGTPIKAMYGGVVAYSDKANGYGNFVSILMNEGPYKGKYMGYGHMNAPSALEVGQTIQSGDSVGAVGNTGRSYGSHLDISVGDDIFTEKKEKININHLFIGKYKQKYEPN